MQCHRLFPTRISFATMTILALVIALATSKGLCAAQPSEVAFTIQSSIAYALQHNTQILSQKQAVAAAEAHRKKKLSDFLPQLRAQYAYTRLDEEKRAFVSVVTSPENLYQFSATLDQPIFSGFSTKTQYEISALDLDIEKLLEKNVRLDLILKVKQAYYALLQKQKLHMVAQQAVSQLLDHARVAENFYAVGMTPKNDVLEAEVELANARQDQVVATNDVLVARAQFNTLLRRPVDAPFTLTTVLTYEPFTLAYEKAVETALEKRTELYVAERQIMRAEKDMTLAKKDYYPSLDLQANYYKMGDDPGLDGGPGIADREEWNLVATASWTLWDWGKTRYGVQEKIRRLQQARLARAERRDLVRQEVKKAYLRVKNAENAILTVEKAVEQAKENLRINQERYKEQVATSTDVLDAQTLFTKTRTNYFNALSAFNISRAALERAMGIEVAR